ncbi:uncharacterized protein LOC144293979 isoform X2 [Canis aureus]
MSFQERQFPKLVTFVGTSGYLNTVGFPAQPSLMTAGTPPRRLQHQLAPRAGTQSRAVSCYIRGKRPRRGEQERRACVLREERLAGCLSRATSPGWSVRSGCLLHCPSLL